MKLPERFEQEMKELLREDYPAYRDSLSVPPGHGLRVNENRISTEDFLMLWEKSGGAPLLPVPWIHNGFFVPEEASLSGHPFYHAGLYYLQDPSAMTPAEVLPVEAGDYVLDLCAAPGGKATELCAKLRGTGLLYANDISASRAKALKKNLELFGAQQAFVTAEEPERLAEHFPEFFDKVLIDAPCSGEGMFRVQPKMMQYWEENGPEAYAPVQKELLESAAKLLRPGGLLLYSTCTFSVLEDEAQIDGFLQRHPEFSFEPAAAYEGFSSLPDRYGLRTDPRSEIRIYPHRMRGEGQFLALLRKAGEHVPYPPRPVLPWSRKEEQYLLPEGHLPVPGIHYLMTGLFLGTKKKERMEYAQSCAMTRTKENWPVCLDLPLSDARVLKYLRQETLALTEEEAERLSAAPSGRPSGKKEKAPDVLVMTEGLPLGFARRSGLILKNRRNPAWRILS